MTIYELALNLIEHAEESPVEKIDITRAAEIIGWLDKDSDLPEDLTPEAFMAAFNDILDDDPAPRLWYAVQTDREDDWGTGSYSLEEAKTMARKQRNTYPDTMIAVIDNTTDPNDPFCLEEITDF